MDHINGNAKCTRKKLIEALAPTPKTVAAPVAETPVAAGETAKPAEVKAPETTPEQTAVIVDLHWLIHQGHVLEFADGRMETAKKPAPKPVKQEKKSPAAKPVAESETVASTEIVTPAEIATSTEVAPAPAPEVAASAPEVPASGEVAPTA